MIVQGLNSGLRRVPAWPIYPATLLFIIWLVWRGASGGLGVEPVEALEHRLGEAALYMLVAGLAVTPLRRFAGLNLLKFRRAIGLSCFMLVTAHLLVWAVLDVQALHRVWEDILKRPYISVGMAGFAVLLPLAITSNNLSVRKMGPAWRKLHKLTYLAAILGAVHYVMLVKGIQMRPILFLIVILGLIGLRFLPKSGKSRAERPVS